MTGGEACLKFTLGSSGAVGYSPQRARSGSWGPFEVHPQRVPRVLDGCAQLAYEGEWLILPPEGEAIVVGGIPLTSLVCTVANGGLVRAELLAFAMNEERAAGSRTRIVGLDGTERASTQTRESVIAVVQELMALQ